MDRVTIDERLVAGLVADQFPEWAALPVSAVVPGGNDNRTFRLGDHLAARLPSAPGYTAGVEKEQRWLPVIAQYTPLPVPAPVALGAPGRGYPFAWSVNRWMQGETAGVGGVADLVGFAVDLSGFLRALQTVPTRGAPPAGEHTFWRGAGLEHYDEETRRAIAALGNRIDGARALALWEEGLGATWRGDPVWFHGDVSSGNLLVSDGKLSGVIDFGTSGVGDPACDCYIGWTFLSSEARRAFRHGLGADEGMWARGRAWTLWKGLISAAGLLTDESSWGVSVVEEIIADPG